MDLCFIEQGLDPFAGAESPGACAGLSLDNVWLIDI